MKTITKESILGALVRVESPLKCTHKRLCIAIIQRLYKKMMANISLPSIKVDDDVICDGHHRYLASILAGYALHKIPHCKTSTTTVINWSQVSFDDETDWDEPEKVAMHNAEDAGFNQITIEELEKLLG
jgi:hypothetical protein